MVVSLNKVTLIGNVGKEPEIRLTQEGKEIVTFPLATTENWKDKNSGERREKTEWHRIVVFIPALVNIIKNYPRQYTQEKVKKWLTLIANNKKILISPLSRKAKSWNRSLSDLF